MGNLISSMKKVVDGLREGENYGTAHIHRSSMSAILASNESGNPSFRKVTLEFLKSFEAYPRGRNRSWNTVPTYMRTLRAVYNRVVDRRTVSYVPHHFRHVYTGTCADKKRVLEKEDMECLMKDIPKQLYSGNRELQRARGFSILMSLLRGMPLVDFAYLKKHDIDENVPTYCQRKTGRMLTVTFLPEAVKLIRQYMNTDSAFPYLSSLTSSKEGTEETYEKYQLALRDFNYQLMILKQVLGLTTDLSSYTVRHIQAMMAYHYEVYLGVISEAMGHSSTTVTETYLKPFKNKKIDEANVMVFSSFRKSFSVGNYLN